MPTDPPTSAPSPRWRADVAMWLAVGLGLLLIYSPLVRADPVLGRDDQVLLEPVRRASGLGDYLAAVRAGQVRDLQPLRDLSFAVDVAVGRATGLGTFHLNNLLLFAAILALAWRLLRERYEDGLATRAVLVALAFHPIFVGSVGWISARKHLLSCALILAATTLAPPDLPARGARRGWAAVALYAAALLAQPINLLWPLWRAAAGWWDVAQRRLLATQTAVALAAGGAVAWANLRYYAGEFVEQTHSSKFVDAGDLGHAASLLALGRDFFNLICPVALATSYAPERAYNLIGLLLLPVFGWVMVRVLGARTALTWLGFFLFPLVPVTARMTNIFTSDTYLLTPAIGLAVLGAGALAKGRASESAKALAVGGLAALFCLASVRLAPSWLTDAALWDHAYQTEPTPNVLAKEAFFRANAGDFETALDAAQRLIETAPAHPEAAFVFARAVYLDPRHAPAEKLAVLDAHPFDDPWFHYYRAHLRAGLGDLAGALADLRDAAPRAASFKEQAPQVAAEGAFICARAGGAGCGELVRGFQSASGPGWSETRYGARLAQLGIADPRR